MVGSVLGPEVERILDRTMGPGETGDLRDEVFDLGCLGKEGRSRAEGFEQWTRSQVHGPWTEGSRRA